jgi:hypothetical protein
MGEDRIGCGLRMLLLAFSIAFLGLIGGAVAFIIVYGALTGVDFMVPDEKRRSAQNAMAGKPKKLLWKHR